MTKLAGAVAVVTGGGSGIGRATALALSEAGARVAVCDLNAGAAKATAEQIAGGKASAYGVDVSSEQQMRELVAEIIREHGGVDVVVNNAGISTAPVPAMRTPLAVYRKTVDVNFWGVVHGSMLFLPHLLERPSASLVNVASFAGFTGVSRMSPYCASKFAVRGFTESLQMEFAGGPLIVTLVCPGETKTSILSNSPVIDADDRERMQANLEASRTGKSPEFVAAAIVAAIQRKRTRVLVGLDTKALDKVVRLLPARYPKLLKGGVEGMFRKATGA
jgi:NAD(P)-dependent dehydrogenase (short-subunit alcohol dehydrogenase family)